MSLSQRELTNLLQELSGLGQRDVRDVYQALGDGGVVEYDVIFKNIDDGHILGGGDGRPRLQNAEEVVQLYEAARGNLDLEHFRAYNKGVLDKLYDLTAGEVSPHHYHMALANYFSGLLLYCCQHGFCNDPDVKAKTIAYQVARDLRFFRPDQVRGHITPTIVNYMNKWGREWMLPIAAAVTSRAWGLDKILTPTSLLDLLRITAVIPRNAMHEIVTSKAHPFNKVIDGVRSFSYYFTWSQVIAMTPAEFCHHLNHCLPPACQAKIVQSIADQRAIHPDGSSTWHTENFNLNGSFAPLLLKQDLQPPNFLPWGDRFSLTKHT